MKERALLHWGNLFMEFVSSFARDRRDTPYTTNFTNRDQFAFTSFLSRCTIWKRGFFVLAYRDKFLNHVARSVHPQTNLQFNGKRLFDCCHVILCKEKKKNNILLNRNWTNVSRITKEYRLNVIVLLRSMNRRNLPTAHSKWNYPGPVY